MRTQRFTSLLAALLICGSANACQCMGDFESSEVLKVYVARVSQVVRVKILSRTTVEVRSRYGPETNTLYRAQLLESIKPASSSGGFIEIRSGTSSCEQYLDIGEEWLLFISEGYLLGQCSPTQLLGDANPRRRALYEGSTYPFNDDFYMRSARGLAEVRRLAKEPVRSSPPSSSERQR